MIGRLGVGEVPISVSGDPDDADLVQTVRDVGGVTHTLVSSAPGDTVEVRGPYGHGWHHEDAFGRDLLLIAGGIGLAPLRPVLYRVARDRSRFGRVSLLYGTRRPQEQLFTRQIVDWQQRHDIDLAVIVDSASPDWGGRVGLVTELVRSATFDPGSALALMCGPEVMMRFVTAELLDRGLPPCDIRWSMERSMACGVGLCGHCQLRELFVCTDGPVIDYPTLAPLLGTREA